MYLINETILYNGKQVQCDEAGAVVVTLPFYVKAIVYEACNKDNSAIKNILFGYLLQQNKLI